MGEGDAAAFQVGVERLDVAQETAAGGGVAGMADGHRAGQPFGEVAVAEGLADLLGVALPVEPLAVVAGDPAGFLAAVLKGVQAERGEGAGVIRAEDPENPAFQPGGVVVRVADRPGPLRVRAHRVFSTRSSTPLREAAS